MTNIYQRFADVNFAAMPRTFQDELRNVVVYTVEHDHLPAYGALGHWLEHQRRDAHRLSIEQRVVLMALPGFTFGRKALPVEQPQRDLWERVRTWALTPNRDLIAVRYLNKMKRDS